MLPNGLTNARRYTSSPDFIGAEIGDIPGGDYTQIEADGSMEMIGDATMWDDLRVPLDGSTGAGISSPQWLEYMDSTGFPGAAGGTSGVWAWHFRNTSEDDLGFQVQMPHGWKLGSTITPHVHWAAKTNTAGDIRFGVELAIPNATTKKFHHVAPATIGRQSAGTLKRVYFATDPELRTYRQMVISALGDASYNGDNSANNGTFTVSAYGNDATGYYIEYTGSGALAEAYTADAGGVVTGYLYRIENTATCAANSRGLRTLTNLPTILMDTHNYLSCEMLCRLYRVLNASVPGGIAESIPIIEFDIHYELDTIGSRQITSK